MTPQLEFARNGRRSSIRARALQLVAFALTLIGVAVAMQPNAVAARIADQHSPRMWRHRLQELHGLPPSGGLAPYLDDRLRQRGLHIWGIREKVSAGDHAPWHAEGPRGRFSPNDRRLSTRTGRRFSVWLETGANPVT